jgi:hypothetical protein
MVMRSDSQFAQSARLAELDEKVSVTLLLFWGPGSRLRIRDVYPGSVFFSISDPKSRIQQKRGEKLKLVVLPSYVAINFIKVNII